LKKENPFLSFKVHSFKSFFFLAQYDLISSSISVDIFPTQPDRALPDNHNDPINPAAATPQLQG
jgi:hypothetical protein